MNEELWTQADRIADQALILRLRMAEDANKGTYLTLEDVTRLNELLVTLAKRVVEDYLKEISE